MQVPAVPKVLPSSAWFVCLAVSSAAVVCVFALASHAQKQPMLLLAAVPFVGLFVWCVRLASRRSHARGEWDVESKRLGFETRILEKPTLEAMSSKHAVFAKTAHGGIGEVLRGRWDSHDTFLVQMNTPRFPAEINVILLPLFWVVYLVVSIGSMTEVGASPSAPCKTTTVALFPKLANDRVGEKRVGPWTLSFSASSTAVFLRGRSVEPKNLEAFLAAALALAKARAVSATDPA